MPAYGLDSKSKGSALLSPPPKVGSFSISAQKTVALLLSLLSTVVIFGSVANTRVVAGLSSSLTNLLIAWSVILAFLYLVILALTYRAKPKDPWAPKMDMGFWILISTLWIPLVGVASSQKPEIRNITTWFAWIGWASAIFITLKAYHNWVESDLPTPNPEGFDDEDYIYG